MRADLRRGLTAAIRAKDRVAVAALRSALAAIDNAEAVPVTETPATPAEPSGHVATAAVGVGAAEADRRHLTDADQRAIVENEVRERTAAARDYARLGRDDAAERLRAEAAVLNGHLEGRA